MIDYGIVLIKGVPNKHGLLQTIRFLCVIMEMSMFL